MRKEANSGGAITHSQCRSPCMSHDVSSMSLTREGRATAPMAVSWGPIAVETRSTIFCIAPVLSRMAQTEAHRSYTALRLAPSRRHLADEARQPRTIPTPLLYWQGRFAQGAARQEPPLVQPPVRRVRAHDWQCNDLVRVIQDELHNLTLATGTDRWNK
jgi:hypothetical protein